MDEIWTVWQEVWEEVNSGEVVSADVATLLSFHEHVANVSKGNCATWTSLS